MITNSFIRELDSIKLSSHRQSHTLTTIPHLPTQAANDIDERMKMLTNSCIRKVDSIRMSSHRHLHTVMTIPILTQAATSVD